MIFSLAILFFISCNNRATNGDKTDRDSTSKTDSVPPQAVPTEPDTTFTAFGNEPFWALYVIHDRKLVFHPMDGPDIEVPYVTPTEIDAMTKRYNSAGDSATVELTIIKKDCSDGMSDLTHKFETKLKVNAVTYQGCGRE